MIAAKSDITECTIKSDCRIVAESVFENCTKLESVYISDLAKYLNIIFGNGASSPMRYANKLYLNNRRFSGDLVIPDGVTNIPPYAFHSCDAVTSVTMPYSVTSVGNSAFNGCVGLEKVYAADLGAWCSINFSNAQSNLMYYTKNLYVNDTLVTNVTVLSSVTVIGGYVFYNCEGLKSVIISDGITSIGDSAFYNCGELTSVTIPDSVTSIGSNTFSSCSALNDVYISGIGWWIENYNNFRSNPISYANNIYNNGELVKNLIIPDGVAEIKGNTFSDWDWLETVTIPESVTSIGNKAFYNCKNLTTVNYNAKNCTQMGLSYNYVFQNCAALSTVNIGNTVEIIPDYAFSGCNGLTEVIIPDSVTGIGADAFYNCSGILSAIIGNNVTSIDESAFSSCKNLKKIFIPKSMTEIEQSAFSNCNALTAVKYGGNEADWREVYIGNNNDSLKNATIHYNSAPDNAKLTDSDY